MIWRNLKKNITGQLNWHDLTDNCSLFDLDVDIWVAFCNLTCWSLDGGDGEDDGFVCSFVFDSSVSFPSSSRSPLISWDLFCSLFLFSFLWVFCVKDEDVSS